MGFGWLFVGYFFVQVMALYSPLSFAMLAGYPMIIMGLWHLAHYHPRFAFAFYFSLASLPFALYFSLFSFSQLGLPISDALFEGLLYEIAQWGYFVFLIGLHLLLLYAVAGLTGELRLILLQSNAWRNMIIVALFFVLDFLARMPFLSEQRTLLALPLLLLRLCYIFLNLLLIFKCYRNICSEEEGGLAPLIGQASPSKEDRHDKE